MIRQPEPVPQRTVRESQTADRRRRHRYGFSTSLRYRVISNGKVVLSGSGRTLNMSADGMLVELDTSPELHGKLEFLVDWLGAFHGAERCQLILVGQVVRSEGRLAAVTILHSEFRTAGCIGVRSSGPRAVA